MADPTGNETSTQTTTPTAATDAGATVTTPTPPATEMAQPSKDEWVAYRKEQRKTQDMLNSVLEKLTTKEPEKATKKPAPTADEGVAALQAELAEMKARTTFQDALDEADVSLTKPQKSILMSFYAKEKPSNAVEWIKDTAAKLGIGGKPAAPAAAPDPAKAAPAPTPAPPQAQTRSDTGPPGATHGEVDLSRMTKSQLMSLPEKQRRELYRQRDERMGNSNYNPLTKTLDLGKH